MNTTESTFHKACLLADQGKLAEARQLLREAIEATPDDAFITLGLGIVSEKQGKHEDAEKWLGRAEAASPDDPDFHIRLANALAGLGRTEDAIGEYQTAIYLSPDCFEAHSRLAGLLQADQQYMDAEYHCEYASKLRPDDPACHARLAQIYMQLKKPVEARASAETALKLDSGNSDASTLLEALKDLEESGSAFDSQIATGDPHSIEQLGQGCMAFRLNNPFISDKRFLFRAPEENFCRSCFQYRYSSQMEAENIGQISHEALDLARSLDDEVHDDALWRVYSINEQKLLKAFELAPYENCPACGVRATTARPDALAHYKRLLEQQSTPHLDALREQLFSFGFARDRIVTRSVGLGKPLFDKLLGNNYHARVYSKITYPDGRQIEETPMGLSPDPGLAELKSYMEFIERYAFFLRPNRLRTEEYDDRTIDSFLERYRETPSISQRDKIRAEAIWGMNLSSGEVSPVPVPFIFNTGEISFIEPSTSGFSAHTDFQKALCGSILELIERDAFVRFWHDPQRAFSFRPDPEIQAEIDNIIAILAQVTDNTALAGRCFVVESPTRVPVAMIAISSNIHHKPPALCFGFGADFDLAAALGGALNELRINAINLVKAVTLMDGFLARKFTGRIVSPPDRMGFYSTATPREKLWFLDRDNPLVDGVMEEPEQAGLDVLVDRFRRAGFDIYGLDLTPRCFQDKNVYVTRAFSPHLYPLQFGKENVFNLPTGPMTLQGELPHCFI